MELLLHGVEGLIVLVIWIGTLYVSDCVVGTEAGEGVNMAVCIIASEVSMIEPEDALGMEIAQEAFFYLLPVKVWITLRGEEALAGGQECPASIALDTASLEDELERRLVGAV